LASGAFFDSLVHTRSTQVPDAHVAPIVYLLLILAKAKIHPVG
jgi:hypothetical protein